jgi:hypothetical protein
VKPRARLAARFPGAAAVASAASAASIASIALAAAVTLAFPGVAHAANTRVIVAGPEGDAVASRLQKELTAMGFEPIRVDEAAGCAEGAVSAWVDEMKASAAACSDGSAASVWISTRAGLRVAEVVAPSPGDASADVVAVRAAEITRASLELSATEPGPGEVLKPAPTWGPATPADVDVVLKPKKRIAAVPHTPVFAMGTGISALMGADATAAALDTELQLRIARRVALSARAALTFDGATVTLSRSPVRVAPSIFGIGPVLPLAATDAFFIPRIGAGAGVVWLRSKEAAFDTVNSTFGPSDSIVSPMAFITGAMSMRVGGALRLTLEGLLGASAHRMVVRSQGEDVAYWGQPFGTVALRAEVMFR